MVRVEKKLGQRCLSWFRYLQSRPLDALKRSVLRRDSYRLLDWHVTKSEEKTVSGLHVYGGDNVGYVEVYFFIIKECRLIKLEAHNPFLHFRK